MTLTGRVQVELDVAHLDGLLVGVVAVESPPHERLREVGADGYHRSVGSTPHRLVGAVESVERLLTDGLVVYELQKFNAISGGKFAVEDGHRDVVGVATETQEE